MKKGREKKHRICAAFLCVCMLLSLPGISDIFPVVAAAEQAESFREKNIITTFDPLPEDIKVQTVFVGTDRDELDLPEELTVCLLRESSEQKAEESGQENTGETDNIEENSDTEIKNEQSEEIEETTATETEYTIDIEDKEDGAGESAPVEEQESAPSEERQESAFAQETHTVTMQEYHAENVISVQTLENTQTEKQEETVTIDGVTWQSDPEYDGNAEGIYIFTAVLPEGYTLAEDVSLPQITVTVEVESGIDVIIQTLLDRIAALPDAEEYLASEPNMEEDEDTHAVWEEKLYAYAEEALVIWEEYEALTEEQQAQMSEEELAKLEAWMEIAEQFSNYPIMLADNSGHHGESDWQALTASDTTLSGGKFYLSDENGDLTMGTITIDGDVTLCLNGHKLQHDSTDGSAIVVTNGTFTLCDCQDDWDYTSSFDESSKTYSCEVTGQGGCIIGGNGKNDKNGDIYQGGGVYVTGSNTVFNMSSGRITGGNIGEGEKHCGGGVAIIGGRFNMSGGCIDGNNAACGGGVYLASQAEFTMSGNAVIMNNEGAGVYCWGGDNVTFNMTSGNILGNKDSTTTGGIFLGPTSSFIMTGGTVEGNTVERDSYGIGGGVYCNGATMKLSGGSIQYNIGNGKAAGGIRMLEGTMEVSDNICISNNYNGSGANNVSLAPNTVITVIKKLLNDIDVTFQPPRGSASYPVKIAQGTDSYPISDADWSHFSSDNEKYEIQMKTTDTGNELYLAEPGKCDLFNLTVSGATLSPSFDSGKTEYTSEVANGVNQVNITATLATTASGADITIKVNDGTTKEMENGKSKTVDLVEGENTIAITVTSGELSKTYTIVITREKPTGFKVTLNGNEGSAGTNLTSYVPGLEVELPTDWTRTGYDFAGWYDNKDCTGTAVTEISATDTGDKEYWAKWTPISYSISYDLEGGTATGNPTSYTIESSAITLNNPTKEGYTFTGWSGTDLTGSNNKSVTIESGSIGHRTYTANWEPESYKVGLNGKGGSGGTDLTGYTYGIGANLPTDWTKTGYDFAGWYVYENYSGNPITEISATETGNKTFWAKWTPIGYTISYDLDGGTVTANPTTYTIESNAITLVNPSKTGYSFGGWSGTDLTGTDNMSVTIAAGSTGDREYTANWTAAGYTVTLKGGGTGTALTSYTYGIGATLPTGWTKTGYTFAGWYNNENCTGDPVTEISATDIGDKTFWAKWTPQTYQVTFHYHGADGGNTETSKNVTYDGAYGTLPVPTRTGYTFQGWYTEADGKGTEVNAGTTVTTASAHTLHAYWKDETAPNKPVLQNDVTLPADTDWTNTQTTIPLKLYDGVGVDSLLVSVDGSPYTEVSGFSGGTGSMTYDYTPVLEGKHTYQFIAKDAAGNTSVASDIFTVRLDQTKPVIGTLTYDDAVYTNLWHWIIGKKSMVVHVPVTDAGSGVTEISYTMTPRDAAGNLASSSAETKTATVTNGEAKITFDKDFRGTITINCTDKADNAADSVTIGADAGGVIVEDTPPTITVLADRNISDTQQTQPSGVAVSEGYYNSAPALFVTVKDDTGNAITAGLASVTYQVDGGEEKSVTVDTSVLQEEVTFTIPATEIAAGSTQIKVIIKATDNAGNTADREITINVKGPEKQPAAVIDYRQEELTGLVPSGSYTIDGTETTADQEGHIAIKENWLGGSISIVKKGNGSETSDSPAQSLSVPARPAAPNAPELSARTENSITLKTITRAQYRRTDGTGNWQDSTVFDGLNPKTPYTFVAYYPATDTSFASKESGETEIGTMPTPPTPDKLGIDYEHETLTPASGIEAFSDQSCTTPVAAGSAEDYMGTTVYIRYQADGIIPASATTAVSVPERTPTPTPGTIDATYPQAADGKLTGLTAGGSYMLSSDGGNTWESRTANESGEITGLKAGTYDLYVAAGSTNFRSETATVTVGAKPATPYDKPAIQIDYDNRTLTGFEVDGTYFINEEQVSVGQDGSIEIDVRWFGTQLSIVRKGNEKDKLDSEAQDLRIPTIPPKPTPAGVDVSTAGGTGKLTGLTAGTVYEISTDGGKTWISSETANGSGEITGLAPGTYVVRVKVGVSNFASEPSESATIGAYKVTVTFMANGEKYTEVSVDYGGTLTDIPAVPPKKDAGDQTYAGEWCSDEQGTIAVFTNITADMTVYAVYTTAYTVTLQSGTGYTLSAINDSISPVKEGGSFTFRFILQEGYHCINGSFAVMVGEDEVELTDGTYTITDIRRDLTVRVEGVDKDADNPPSGGGDNGDDDDDDSGDSKPTPTPTPPQTPPPTDTQPTTPTTPPGTTPPVTENEPEGRKPETTPEPGETPGSEEPENNETQPPAETSQPQIPDTTPGSLTYSVGKGAVIVTLNNVDETVCAARVADASAVAQAVLSEEELAEVKQGQIIEIRIDVERLDIVPENDAEVIEKGIEDCQEQIPGLVMGMYVDISMYMRIGSGDWNAIHATNKPVEIILDVPGELAELTADFYIMRAHEGEYLLMEDLDETQETITIQTEAFSTYAILYQMHEDAGEKPAAKCSLCHICPTFWGICYFIWLAIIIVLALLVIYLIIRRKRKKEENEEQ